MDFIQGGINQLNELTQGLQVGGSQQFNLDDNTFANLLNSKLDGLASGGIETYTQLLGPLGVPAGLNIEGLTDPFKVNAIDSSSLSELSLNQSEAAGEDENILKLGLNKTEDILEQLGAKQGKTIDVTELFQLKNSQDSVKNAAAQDKLAGGFGHFMQKQAANLYGTMGKAIVHNLSDILSAI